MDFAELAERTKDPFVGYFVNRAGCAESMNHVQLLSHIVDNLYVGGHSDTADVEDFFSHIFSLYVWGAPYVSHEDTVHESVRMYDSPDEDPELVLKLVDNIVNALHEGGNVLIHCQAGINRSNLVAALVLRKWKGMSSQEAIDLLRERRTPLALANQTFERYLLNLDNPEPVVDYPGDGG